MSKNNNPAPRPGAGHTANSAANNAANQTFLMDIEESVRRDEMKRVWQEYGPYLIAGIVLAVILTGVLSAYRAWDKSARVSQTTALVAALEAEDAPRALGDLSATLRPGHRAVARLTQAAALVQDGRGEEALAVFEALADDKAAPEMYRDLALLESVRVRAAAAGADAQALRARLAPLLKQKKNPWYAQAQLQAALLAAQGGPGGAPDYKAARGHLDNVMKAPGVPPALAQKAQALDHVYEIRGGENAGAAPASGKAGSKEAAGKAAGGASGAKADNSRPAADAEAADTKAAGAKAAAGKDGKATNGTEAAP